MNYSDSDVRAIKWACCLSGFITPLLSTMMNLSLVHIGSDFGVGSHDLAYVNTSFLLASVIFMVPFAKIGDIIGKKKTFIIGLAVIVIGCVLAFVSPTFWFMIACRGVIGAGAAALTTVNISMLADVVPKAQRGAAIGIQTMFVYIGLAMGPAIGGTLNDICGWRALFLLSIPFAVASLFFLFKFHHEIRPDEGGVFDSKSAVLYGMAIALTMAGVMSLPQVYSFILLAIGLVLMALFIKKQIGNEHCLLEMGLFKNRTFTGSCVAAFMNYAASYSGSFFVPLYLQSIGQLTATQAGLLMMIQPVVQIIGTPIFGRLSDSVSNKALLPTIGMGISSIGVLSVAFYGLNTPIYVVVASMLVTGLGFAFFSAPNTNVIMSSVPWNHTGEASSMVSFMRQTGMMVSMGIGMMFITLIMGSTDNLRPETYGLFIDVIRVSFITCFAMCMVGMVTSMFRNSSHSE